MADVKIQDLLSTTTVADTDLFIVEDNADTKKITKANLVSTLGINDKAPTVHGHSMSQITDYQEGTWTPVVVGGTSAGVGTYYVQTGVYTKIGRVVYFTIHLGWGSHTGVGSLDISLPIASGGLFSPCSILVSDLGFTGVLTPLVYANSPFIRLYSYTPNSVLQAVQIDTEIDLYISGFYMV